MNLYFIGNGRKYVSGVPARDLSDSDIKQCGMSAEDLVATGLYAKKQPPEVKSKPAKAASKPKTKPKKTKSK